MAEYIEREAVLWAMSDYFHKTDPDGKEQIGVLKMHRLVREYPAADVAPVEHGRWVLIERTIGMKTYRCSECKDDDFWNTRFCFGYESYCPNCGAHMKDGDGNG